MQHRGRFIAGFVMMALVVVLSSGCLKSSGKTIIKTDGWAENHFYTTDGRLFVSGEQNVYEVVQNPETGTYERITLYNVMNQCIPKGIMHMFHGIAEYDGYLLLACNRLTVKGIIPLLLYARLDEITVDDAGKPIENLFKEIKINDLNVNGDASVTYANGMAVDNYGHIYIGDSPGNNRSIKRISIGVLTDDNADNDFFDLKVLIHEQANGMTIDGDNLFYSHLGSNNESMIRKLDLASVVEDATGNLTVGEPETVLSTTADYYDDLSIYKSDGKKGLLVSNFIGGCVIAVPLYDPEGKREIKFDIPSRGYFASPSSVRQAASPMFERNEITVTELGAYGLCDNVGNRLSSFICDDLP